MLLYLFVTLLPLSPSLPHPALSAPRLVHMRMGAPIIIRRKRLIPRLYVRVDEWVTRIDGLNLHL